MNTAPEDLSARIEQLTDAEVLEASRYYLVRRVEAASPEEVEEAIQQETLELGGDPQQLFQLQDSLAKDDAGAVELLRFLLRVGAGGSESDRREVLEAVNGVGQKQIILETALVLAMGTLVSLYLIHRTGGKRSESERTVIETLPDGQVRVTHEKQTIYATPASALGNFFGWLRSLPGAK